MPAPSNDNFASATTITGASGSTTGTTASATSQGSEPGHYNYNRGPAYPTARGLVGPFNSVWYSWTPAASGNYYFTTRDLTGGMATNFPSTVQVFGQYGSGLSGLGLITPLLDQSAGDGNGNDNGASYAFAATASTTYYIQVDTRSLGATGNFKLSWAAYNAPRLGSCAGGAVNMDPSTQCVSTIRVTGGSSDAWYSFGSQPAAAGNYLVIYVDGTPILPYANAVYPTPQVFPIVTIIDGDFSGFSEWSSTSAYFTGNKVIQLENYADYAPAIATGNVPNPPGTAPYTGGGSCNAPWVCYGATDSIPTTICQWSAPIPHPATGVIGLCYLAGGTSGVVTPYPNYSLLYFPMDTTVLNTSPGFALSGSGTSWTISFNIRNNSSQRWDGVTATLLNTGGVSGASAAITGLNLTAGASTGTGNFTFTATPGMVTATIQLSRNGIVACTLAYPLYPILALSFTAAGGASGLNVFERTGCTPHTWVQAVRATTIWPPAGDIPSSWGDTVNFVFSVASGPATLCNDASGSNCIGVANITGSVGIGGATDNVIKPSFQVTGSVQSVPIQCTLTWAGPSIALPTFTQTLSIPAT